jgi:hypothetical protein
MSATRVVTIAVFALAGVLALAVQLAARREGSRVPSLAELCDALVGYEIGRLPVGRIMLLGFWWWVGWHLFAR